MSADKKLCMGCMEYTLTEENTCPSCGYSKETHLVLPHQLTPGTLLNNKYLVGRVLGEGGFGITYVGRDKVLDMKIAIKEFYMSGYVNRNNTVSSEIVASLGTHAQMFEKNREKFLSEARVLAKFASEPGIVGIRDFFLENNTAYIIMDYLDGETLSAYLDKNQMLSYEKTLDLLMPVMKSMENVHNHGVIHRDISPDNIMLTKSGQVKLLDFGAAREVSQNDIKSMSVILKPGYAPEEQYRSKGHQGPWTDVYALCATMYKCITGQTPDDSMERMFQDNQQSPSQVNRECPVALGNVIMKGMAIRQVDRYMTIRELRQDIEKALENPDDMTIAVKTAVPNWDESVEKPEQKKNAADNNQTVYAGEILDDQEKKTQDSSQTVYAGELPSEESKTEPKPEPKPELKPEAKPEPKSVPKPEVKPEPKDESKAVPMEETQAKPEVEKGSKKPLIIAAAILVLAVIAIVVFFVGGGSKTRESSVLPSELEDFAFVINDHTFSVPTTYDAFVEAGWEFEDLEELNATFLEPNAQTYGDRLINGYGSVMAYFYNPTANTLPLSECVIYRVELTDYNFNSNYLDQEANTFSTEEGIGFGSTLKDLKNTYGKDYYKEYSYYGYQGGGTVEGGYFEKYVEFSVQDNKIYIVNFANKSVPENYAVDNYSTEKPASYDESFDTFIAGSPKIIVDGKEYTVPCTVQSLVDQGWEIEQKDEYVPSHGSTDVYLRQDLRTVLIVTAYNYTDEAVIPEYALITSLGVGKYTSDYELSGKEMEFHVDGEVITYDTTEDEVNQMIEKNGWKKEMDYIYPYGDNEGKLFILFDSENKVSTFTYHSGNAVNNFFASKEQ